jgi:hypothetical protein
MTGRGQDQPTALLVSRVNRRKQAVHSGWTQPNPIQPVPPFRLDNSVYVTCHLLSRGLLPVRGLSAVVAPSISPFSVAAWLAKSRGFPSTRRFH